MPLDLSQIRAKFPALALTDHGRPRIYLDNPGGTQVAQPVLDRMNHYLVHTNANKDGAFATAIQSDEVLHEARAAVADLLHAASPDEIVFGPNMTTLTFALSRSLGKWLKPGDEIVITKLDHDANVAPWLLLAQDTGAVIKWVDIREEDCTLDMADFENQISDKTKIVACGYASNAVGTINDVGAVVGMAHAAGALVFVDAVQYAPHGPVDVQALGCDFLVCSSYKFFGPHMGMLYGKYDLLDRLPAYKVRPAGDQPPYKFETGTQNHEGIAGVLGAVEYLEWLGKSQNPREASKSHAKRPNPKLQTLKSERRAAIEEGMKAMVEYEQGISRRLITGLAQIPGVKVWGIIDPGRLDRRVPTVSFTRQGWHPRQVAEKLAGQNIFVWDGNYYALSIMERLDLQKSGGMVRVGAAHYNTMGEIDRLVEEVGKIAGS
jgi:cysteine desulfurase family protein (TIGR01976 family)